jgi:sugar phosphate isomerase/epimerase
MPRTLADKLGAAAEAGYKGVENDLTYFGGRPEDVRGLAGSLGLEIVALQPFRDFKGLPEPARSHIAGQAAAGRQHRADPGAADRPRSDR